MTEQSAFASMVALLGRICIAMIFLVAGAHKILDFQGTVTTIAAEGLPFAQVIAALACAVEMMGGLFVLLGYRTRFGAFILFLFTLPTTFLFHDFWTQESELALTHMQHFMKNIAILGATLYIMSFGAGKISFDG